MASLTQTIEQQTKEITTEAARKRKKREAKERIKNIAYNIIYNEFYKRQEDPLLIYLKLNNLQERQKFLNDLPILYKIKNDYINEQEASDIYTKELSRQFKVFKENKKYIDQQNMEYLQEIEAEEIEEETPKEKQPISKTNYIQNTLNEMPTLELLGALGTICIEFIKIPLALVSFIFGFTTEMARPAKRKRR